MIVRAKESMSVKMTGHYLRHFGTNRPIRKPLGPFGPTTNPVSSDYQMISTSKQAARYVAVFDWDSLFMFQFVAVDHKKQNICLGAVLISDYHYCYYIIQARHHGPVYIVRRWCYFTQQEHQILWGDIAGVRKGPP